MREEARLLHMYEDQRAQLEYRRKRENDVFMWTATILLGFIGATLLVNSPERPALLQTGYGATLACAVVLVVTLLSIAWQQKQRRLIAAHQRFLAELQEALGCFSVGPVTFASSWRDWGNRHVSLRSRFIQPSKLLATGLLGLLALVAGVAPLWL